MSSLLNNWSGDDYQILERGVLLARHRLHETGLFSDEHLAHILDSHPPDCLHVNTMGTDANEFEWREGDRNGVPGQLLLQTVSRGRLWLNIRNMLDHHADFRHAINSIYDELEANSPDFKAVDRSANLLISSPGAIVHYHIDVPVNMLWHIRGVKRVWVYPFSDSRFVSAEVTERVFAGEMAEDIPYNPSFDRYALTFDVQPGQMLTWPQNAPHRVTNVQGLNVSLSTEHKNSRAVRRINVALANHFLRKHFGWNCGTADVDGPAAHAKQILARTVRYYNKFSGKRKRQFKYPLTFRVDPLAPLGYSEIDADPACQPLAAAM